MRSVFAQDWMSIFHGKWLSAFGENIFSKDARPVSMGILYIWKRRPGYHEKKFIAPGKKCMSASEAFLRIGEGKSLMEIDNFQREKVHRLLEKTFFPRQTENFRWQLSNSCGNDPIPLETI